jgi:hypothetical protein
MRADEIRGLFREYVFGFIKGDIEREIWLARKFEHDEGHGSYPGPHPGGGNVLAALGLVCYTEFLASFEPGTYSTNTDRFSAFLGRMGDCYQMFDEKLRGDTYQKSVYNVFRNGLAHEYFVKRNCTISMIKGSETCGIGERNGRYFFAVERYLEDFLEAARRLEGELLRLDGSK